MMTLQNWFKILYLKNNIIPIGKKFEGHIKKEIWLIFLDWYEEHGEKFELVPILRRIQPRFYVDDAYLFTLPDNEDIPEDNSNNYVFKTEMSTYLHLSQSDFAYHIFDLKKLL